MIKIAANKLAYPTFRHTKVNDVDVTIPVIEQQPAFEKNGNSDAWTDYDVFSGVEYAVSSEVLSYNKNFGNFYQTYHTQEGETKDFGKVVLQTTNEYPTLLDTEDLIAEKNSTMNVLLSYRDEGTDEKFRHSVIRIWAKENATVNLYISQTEVRSKSLESIVIVTQKDAKVNVRQYEMGAVENYVNTKIELNGENAFADVKSIYFGHDEDRLDMIYHVDHNEKKTFSDIVVNGAVMDDCYKSFKSTLDFKEGCGESQGNEEEYTVLLDDSVLSVSVPILLCHEDDVFGNHAASSGNLDPELLFYLMSRGIDREQAETLIVESKYAQTIDLLEDADEKSRIWDYFRSRMNRR